MRVKEEIFKIPYSHNEYPDPEWICYKCGCTDFYIAEDLRAVCADCGEKY